VNHKVWKEKRSKIREYVMKNGTYFEVTSPSSLYIHTIKTLQLPVTYV